MIGLIGAGSMGTAIMRGILEAHIIKASDIVFSRRDTHAGTELAGALGVRYVASNIEVVRALHQASNEHTASDEHSDRHSYEHSERKDPRCRADLPCSSHLLILAVKPAVVPQVLKEISSALAKSSCIVVSLAAGLPITAIESYCAPGQAIVRAMPNVAISMRSAITALCPGSSTTPHQMDAVRKIFDALGQSIIIPEKDFSAFTAIAGSSPAWTLQYIDSLARGALNAGMPHKIALQAAAQAVYGTAQLALASLQQGIKPQELLDTVTSPGGTTIAGLIAAENRGFSCATLAAVQAALERDSELARHNPAQ